MPQTGVILPVLNRFSAELRKKLIALAKKLSEPHLL